MYRKNTAGQFIGFQLNKTADGTPLTGATVAVRRCIDGTFAAATGTVTEDTGAGSNPGGYKFAFSQADTNGNDISFWFSATSGITVMANIITTAGDPTDAVRFGLTALPNAAANAAGGLPISIAGALDLDEMNVDIEAIQTQTDKLAFTVTNQVDANVLSLVGDATAAAALKRSTDTMCYGTCSGGTTTTAVVSTLVNPASLTDSGQLIGRTILFLGNTGTANVQAQASNITGSTTGSTPTITFTAMTHAPANGDVFVVV